jgi:hypothetical protein
MHYAIIPQIDNTQCLRVVHAILGEQDIGVGVSRMDLRYLHL